MGIKIDLTGIEAENEERVYIKQAGNFTLKVVKVTEATAQSGNKKIKVHFIDKHGRYTIDEFTLTKNALWKLKLLTKALKLPNVLDTDMFLDRYVIATVEEKPTQSGGIIYQITKYEASSLTNTYVREEPKISHEDRTVEIELDEIPF